MLRSFLYCGLLTAVSLNSAMAQLQSVIIEPYVIHDGSIGDAYFGTLENMTTYHVYAVCTNPSDELSAVYGDSTAPLSIASTTGFYQHPFGENVGWEINPEFFGFAPTMEYDSWITLGVMNESETVGQPHTVGMDVAFSEFAAGGDLVVDTENGGSWFTLFGDTQAQAGDDLKVLIAQLTVSNDAVITGNVNIQMFVNGLQVSHSDFQGFALNMPIVEGCTLEIACNYDPNATEDDGSCAELDECGVCGGNGIQDGQCDCEGNVIDECGVCGGNGIQDGQCDCEGNVIDECGVCGGTGIPEGDCDCLGNTSDECGVCGGAGIPEGVCDCEGNAPVLGYDCNGECLSDQNQNGICDYLELEAIQADLEDGIYCGEGTQWVDSLQACMVTEVALMQACGEGTYWDEEAQACLANVTCAEDLNGDGVIGTVDLLQLLSSYGSFCEAADTSEWSCGDPMNYHGYDYATVQIGEQCWFAENLRTEFYQNGDTILSDFIEDEWASSADGAQCVYGEDGIGCESLSPEIDACNSAESLAEYGRLYNWYAVDDIANLCPESWHVPSDDEWTAMANFLGGRLVAGMKIKETHGWVDDGAADNSSGISGLPAGGRSWNGANFWGAGNTSYWWTSTAADTSDAWFQDLNAAYPYLNHTSNSKNLGFSVRCIRDTE